MNLKDIQEQVRNKQLFYTRHAIQRMLERDITPAMVEKCILTGELIENYPEDKYGPSCLVAGKLPADWLHVVLSMKVPPWVITTYHPNEVEWIDFLKRKK